MKKYRKKPIIIEAVQYKKDKIGEILDFAGDKIVYHPEIDEYYCVTLEGPLYISENDYIIKGVRGEFYPCKPDIFEETYEEVRDRD